MALRIDALETPVSWDSLWWFLGLISSLAWMSLAVLYVTTCFGSCLFLSATDFISCHFLCNFNVWFAG